MGGVRVVRAQPALMNCQHLLVYAQSFDKAGLLDQFGALVHESTDRSHHLPTLIWQIGDLLECLDRPAGIRRLPMMRAEGLLGDRQHLLGWLDGPGEFPGAAELLDRVL